MIGRMPCPRSPLFNIRKVMNPNEDTGIAFDIVLG